MTDGEEATQRLCERVSAIGFGGFGDFDDDVIGCGSRLEALTGTDMKDLMAVLSAG
ncbi:MAG: hypothetical protein RIB59_08005 [Rhodospirillales bacterium]